MRKQDIYLNNPNLPNKNYKHHFTKYELDEFIRCSKDPVYFARKYIKIVNVDRGLIPFDMWGFQENMINTFHTERFVICKLPRQSGKTVSVVTYLLHYLLFNENVNVAILANKSAMSREILGRMQLSFEYLPAFLKQGVVEWNKGSIEFANGSRALADATSGSSVRGRSFNIIFLDEFAFVPNNISEAFFMSTYPTISSGQTTKVIIVSTPNGLNLFYKMWTDAIQKRSLYKPIEIHWSDVPGRDQKWKEETIRNTSEEQFRQEFEVEFIGSTNTLISASKLKSLVWHDPKEKQLEGKLDVHKRPERGRTYAITVDVSEGLNQDYSSFSVFDVTEIPYRQVAKYRNNQISPVMFPTYIMQAAMMYNEAFVLVEINSIGLQVADIIHYDFAYENLIKIEVKGKRGQQHSPGYKKSIAFGVKMTKQTKNIGCTNIKTLIESDKLLINDYETIQELMTFSANKQSYAAEEGNNDDLAMTLVLFGWLTSQKFFKESIDSDIRKSLQMDQFNLIDQDIVPLPVIDDGLNYNSRDIEDTDLWENVNDLYYPNKWNL